MTTGAVGGADVPPYLVGVREGVGTNNIGLLVRVAGRVTYKIGQYIYVDDGCNIPDTSSTRIGVMVKCPDTTTPVQVGDSVVVTGVIQGSVPVGWETNRRFMQMRDWNDLVVYPSVQ